MTKQPGQGCPQTKLYFNISKPIRAKFAEIATIENMPEARLLEKMITNYIPVPAILAPGEFRSIGVQRSRTLNKLKPGTIIVSVFWNTKIGIDYKFWRAWRANEVTWEEFQRKYIERLMLPDAQEEIARLRKFAESQDVYITSWEADEEHSMRKIATDFINGKATWK